MKYDYTYAMGTLTNEEKAHFENAFIGYKPTGEILEESYMEERGLDGGMTGYVVFKSTSKRTNWTPYGMCRDCGDHFIIAKYDHYDRIDKAAMTRTSDVEDK